MSLCFVINSNDCYVIITIKYGRGLRAFRLGERS